MKVIIPLAGKGTRLRPHTHITPKPMLKIAGKPVMEYVLDDLRRLGTVEEIVYITGHLKEKVEEYARTNFADIPSVLASTQAGRSTTATSGTGPSATGRMPVSFSTCATATAAASCSSRTTWSASARVVGGPALISFRAVRPARSQSTIEEALVIASPYAAEPPR